jgi:hypothetical protein
VKGVLLFWTFLSYAAAADVTLSPRLLTWNSTTSVSGSGWSASERVTISLRGPLTWPGVEPADITLGTTPADGAGNFAATFTIPYDSGLTGPNTRIPRPGLYEARASGAASGAAAADLINLAPATYTGENSPFDWTRERGGRDGVLPGEYHLYSPERFDPEWITVWDERPVELYGTIAPAGSEGREQPSRITSSDNPATHYGHDANFFVVPDPAYVWVLGTSNYHAGEADSPELGRIEIEWETLNNGSTAGYTQGNIGLPLWVNPTVGDRVYVLGRWILDAGHPELGGRTEIHPPRLLATMRQRATQVDIYVSGHGGGANRVPLGLSELLAQGGWGGGRMRDVLSAADQEKYYRAGPLSSLLAAVVGALVQQLTGMPLSGPVFADAGPSAFSWGKAAGEELPVNDRNYDFDVPLPTPPDGASSVFVETITQPQHTTAVIEEVTFPTPTTAHVHLPYLGADNGIYARTLKFSWNVPGTPADRLRVRLNRITPKDSAGTWQLWADVSGQWTYLGPLRTTIGQPLDLPSNSFDVLPGATLRILAQGYRAACVDDFFGGLLDMSAYLAGLTFLQKCGPNDNENLGSAILELPADPSSKGTWQAGNSHFEIEITVE